MARRAYPCWPATPNVIAYRSATYLHVIAYRERRRAPSTPCKLNKASFHSQHTHKPNSNAWRARSFPRMDGTPVSSQSVSLCPPTALTTADRSRGSLTLYGLFEVGPVAVRNSLSPGSAGLVRPMFVRSTVKARRFRERERQIGRRTILSYSFIGLHWTERNTHANS